MLRDRPLLRERLQRAEQLIQRGRPASQLISDVTATIEASSEFADYRDCMVGHDRLFLMICRSFRETRRDRAGDRARIQVVVVCGETGSGKTTQLPKICLELGRGVAGMIGHTQPRRIAARTRGARASPRNSASPLGRDVGFKVRFGDQHRAADTYIKLMTDGILLAETQGDRLLEQYDTIIIDEAHERSLNIDFLLGYLKQLLPKRPDLKVIITSATIDPQRFSRAFQQCADRRGVRPDVSGGGALSAAGDRSTAATMSRTTRADRRRSSSAVDELCREGPAATCWSSWPASARSARRPRRCASIIRTGTEILPLYARLSSDRADSASSSRTRGRRIVLATNVAETSLTVPGIQYVIDPGYARISRYSARTKVQRLPIEAISQASRPTSARGAAAA